VPESEGSTVEVMVGCLDAGAQALVGLDPIHYCEVLTVDVAVDRSPLDWARLILEHALPEKRSAMLRTWKLLGLHLAPLDAGGQVLGWHISDHGPNAVVLAVRSSSGLSARLVFTSTPQRVVQTMAVRYDRWFGGPLWRMIAPQHRRFVAGLLEDAATRAGHAPPARQA
jgi:hypothetical protein